MTRTLTAPTMTLLTAVLANGGSLGTGRLVKVIIIIAFWYTMLSLKVFNPISVTELYNDTSLSFFPHHQTSMSVLQKPIPVTRTLIAPTVTVRTNVLVNRGSLETGRLAKVRKIVTFFRLFCSEGVLTP